MITTDTPRTAIAIAEARAEVWQRSAEQAFAEGDADAGERYEATAETYWSQARELRGTYPEAAAR
jgi:uncharacterized protein YbbK (DUF523 family)